MKTAFNNGHILTMTGKNIFKGSVLVEEDRIVAISESPFEADRVIDATDHLVMPGLINAHTHIAMSLLRNYADDLPFWPWLTEKIWPAEANLTEESVYWGSMLSIAEMIATGTTTFNDMYFFTEETIRAVNETGIRANLCRGLVSGKDEEEKLANALTLFDNHHGSCDGRLEIDLGPHAPYTCEPAFLERISRLAQEKGARIHIHLSESEKEVADSKEIHGESPIAHVEALGLFDCHVIAAHCVHVDEKDIALMASKDVQVVNNPSSNLKLANGFAPVHLMKRADINVALGTDGPSSNNNQDMFEEMHIAAVLNKSVAQDTTFLPAYEVLEMATINGAKALGIDDRVGSIEVGKQADLIMIDLEKPHLVPRHNLMSMLVYSASGHDVVTVMVNGRILYEDGRHTTLDLETVLKEATQQARILINEA